MKDGVLKGMRALLAENGRLAANGARRIDAQLNELSRAVYTTCNLCAKDPTRPPLWDIRAREAVQDIEHKRIEYRDAVIDIYGIPVFYTPYLTHPDPSAKRASGILVPTIGVASHLGAFVGVPYYWVIDAQSDATITPIVATQTGPALDMQYRRRFNDGTVTINASIGNDRGEFSGYVFAKGQFALNDTWRWGFDINRAGSVNYLTDYRVADTQDILTSQIYLEGFGDGSYTRLDTRIYQGLTTSIITSQLPFVLPHYQYSFVGQPDALGGRTSVDLGAFNVLRSDGTDTQRVSLSTNWERPVIGQFGDLWKLTLHVDSAAYSAEHLNEQPNFATMNDASSAQAMPTAALELHWPLARDAGSWGTQILEPIAQVLVAPNNSAYANTPIPNEDSVDLEFTDANLFSLNRFPGIDRLEGGARANVALHAAWYFPTGAAVDALVGQAYRLQKDPLFPADSGLENTASDIVSHLSYTPNKYFDLITRERFDNHTMQIHFADAVASAGPSFLRLSVGYFYTTTNPYLLYTSPAELTTPTTPRNEISLGVSTTWDHWKLHGSVRRDLQTNQMITMLAGATYEDECFIFDVSFYRRYTSINNDNGSTAVLFQVTLKTVGEFGFHAF
jgi:LPS-assembly protein